MSGSAILVADAGPAAGLGHISRSSAIAAALVCRGFAVSCYGYGIDEPLDRDGLRWLPFDDTSSLGSASVVLLDSYRLPAEAVADQVPSAPLVVLQEHTRRPEGAALLVNAGASPDEATDDSCLFGFRYAALRPQFWGVPTRVPRERVQRVLVTLGAGAAKNAQEAFATAARRALPGVQSRLIVGPYSPSAPPAGVDAVVAPNDLLDELLETDLCLTAGGQTLLEAMAVGVPSVSLPLVSNQRAQTERLAELGAVTMVEPDQPEALGPALEQLAGSRRSRDLLSKRAQEAVDGYGALRVAFRMSRLTSPNPRASSL
jgi:UDP-2,4-diacetamido-2,4,6-trideoxy-beta-L-altropyranose hydrolase